MAERAPLHIRIVRAIDRFTDMTGTWVAWLNVLLVLVVTYEVFARYYFTAPTVWAYDISRMVYGAMFVLGAFFTMKTLCALGSALVAMCA